MKKMFWEPSQIRMQPLPANRAVWRTVSRTAGSTASREACTEANHAARSYAAERMWHVICSPFLPLNANNTSAPSHYLERDLKLPVISRSSISGACISHELRNERRGLKPIGCNPGKTCRNQSRPYQNIEILTRKRVPLREERKSAADSRAKKKSQRACC